MSTESLSPTARRELRWSPFSPSGAVFWLIVLTMIVRLLIAATTGLGYGESYYFAGAVDPQLSYFDQPPLAFWLGAGSLRLFGLTALALRLPSVLLFAVTTYLMYQLGKRLFGAWQGVWAAVLLNLSFVFTVTGATWFQPDAPLMAFWLACALCVVHILRREQEEGPAWRWSAAAFGWWALAGVMLGLTTLSKYHAAFLLLGVALFALTRREQRGWLAHPGVYLALLINTVMALPIFLWNAENGWISFVFQGGRATASGANLHPEWVLQSVIGQMVWLLPWIWLPLIWQLYRCFRAGPSDEARWFCAWTALPPIAFFTVVTLWSKLGFHFHWQAPGYLMLFPPLGAAVAGALRDGNRRVLWWVRLSALFTIVSLAIMYAHLVSGCWDPYGPKWLAEQLGEDEDPTLEGHDWNELRERFAREGWSEREDLFVVGDRWHAAGKINWALRGTMPVLALHWDARNMAFFQDQEDWLGKDAILVTKHAEEMTRRDYGAYFDSLERLNDVVVHRAGEPVMRLGVYYASNFRQRYPLKYGPGGLTGVE